MLWVQLPPEPITEMSSQSSPECSPPCQGGDRGFKSRRGRLGIRNAECGMRNEEGCGTVRQPAERLVSKTGVCGFNSLPCYSAAWAIPDSELHILNTRRLSIGVLKWL